MNPGIALLFSLAMIATPVEMARPSIDEALFEECDNVADAIGADWCVYQFTDVEVADSGRSATTRVQFSLGCSDDPIEFVQEAEYRVTVSLVDRTVIAADWIESAHLPGGGVREFHRALCAEGVF